MSIQLISKKLFKEQFEDSIAIIEADYSTVYFRYFVSKNFGLGIAITYRFGTHEVEHEYYKFYVDPNIMSNLVHAYVYITDPDERSKIINSEMIKIYNSKLIPEFVSDYMATENIAKESEV